MTKRATPCVAVVLRRTDWHETSRIVTLVTRDFGRRSFLAKGAHRPRSPFLGALDTLHVIEARVRVHEGRGLQIIDAARVLQGNRPFRDDGLRHGLAMHLSEVITVAMPEARADPELFDLYRGGLALFRTAPHHAMPTITAALLLRACRVLGVLADLERCAMTFDALPEQGSIGFSASEGGFVREAQTGRRVDARLPGLARALLSTEGRALEKRQDDPRAVQRLLVLVHELLWTQLGEEPRTSLPPSLLL